MKLKIILLCFSVFTLSGCMFPAGAGAMSGEQLDLADAGPYPTNYEEITKKYILSILKKTNNIEFISFNNPEKTWQGGPLNRKVGYNVYARINIYPMQRENPYGIGVFIRDGMALGLHGPGGVPIHYFKGWCLNSRNKPIKCEDK